MSSVGVLYHGETPEFLRSLKPEEFADFVNESDLISEFHQVPEEMEKIVLVLLKSMVGASISFSSIEWASPSSEIGDF